LSALSIKDVKSVVSLGGVAVARAHARQEGAAKAIAEWLAGDTIDQFSARLFEFASSYAWQTRCDMLAFANFLATKLLH